MYTDRLHLESIQEKDTENCVALFGDKEVMAKYAERESRSRKKVVARINNSWLKRWKKNDPFSAMSVFLKDTGDYIGSVVVGYGDRSGESEMAFLFQNRVWRKGYGTESAGAMIYGFAPETVRREYKLDGKALERIYATSSDDNLASWKLLEKVGMSHQETVFVEKYKTNKKIYSITSDKFMKA